MLTSHILHYATGDGVISNKQFERLIELLVAERKRSGLRQVDLAKRMKRTQTWVARLEAGQRRVGVIEFLALAKAIGFDPIAVLKAIMRD
jgi:transcriptional regulator with XRE-family HTH domain